MSRRISIYVGLCVSLLAFGQATAQPIALTEGKRARLIDRPGTERDKAVVRIAKDPALFTLQDPCEVAASIRISTSEGANAEIPLPCANWKRVGKGFRYLDKTATGLVKVVYKSGKLVLRLKGDAYTALPGPVAHVEARLSLGAARYCAQFANLARNEADKIVAIKPSQACQPLCGDGIAEGSEQCDDGNDVDGDCCSATCQAETGPCDDGDLCTVGDACSGGVCAASPAPPWVNELDYDDFSGILDDRDEFVEIAGPAGTDLGGYKILAVEGNLNGNTQDDGAPCFTDLTTGILTGNPYFTAVFPPGTMLSDDTGTGIGFLTACFTNTSVNHEILGECDVVLPAPATSSNLKNGHLVNTNEVDCPDGVLLLDPWDGLVDALSYEGQVPDVGLYGSLFQSPPYSMGADQGFVQGVSLEKRTSELARAQAATEWSLSGGCLLAGASEGPRVTTLVGDIGAGDDTMVLANAAPAAPFFPPFPDTGGTIRIEDEVATYAARVDTTLQGVARGVDGTAAAPHLDGAVISLETGCEPNSDSPGAVNPGQLLGCVSPCGNGAIDVAAGETCDPAALPTGCGGGEQCVAAGLAGECTCEALCGNGSVDAGEDCDPPGSPTCVSGQSCNPDCTCPPAPACVSVTSYDRPEYAIDLCTAIGAACGAPVVPLDLGPAPSAVSFDLCFRAPDAAGRVAMTIDSDTWFADAEFIPAGPVTPIALTQRNCMAGTATGTLFTQDDGASFPSKRCLAGDPDRLLAACVQHPDCDGPTPTTGNGICGTRDVDYTSVTGAAGTVFAYGDGSADPAGAVLLAQTLNIQAFLGGDVRCTGDGVDPTCVACDGVTPAPAGRLGVLSSAAVSLVFPLENKWSTGSVQNLVDEAANVIDGREVMGNGAIRSAVDNGTYEVAAANATLQVSTPLGVVLDLQFLSKSLWVPAP